LQASSTSGRRVTGVACVYRYCRRVPVACRLGLDDVMGDIIDDVIVSGSWGRCGRSLRWTTQSR